MTETETTREPRAERAPTHLPHHDAPGVEPWMKVGGASCALTALVLFVPQPAKIPIAIAALVVMAASAIMLMVQRR